MLLHKQRDLYRDRLALTLGQLRDLESYLTSAKFAGPDPFDKYVNRDDILRWIEQNIRPSLTGEMDCYLADLDEKAILMDATVGAIAPITDFPAYRLMVGLP